MGDHTKTFFTGVRGWMVAALIVCCACQDEQTVAPPESAGPSAAALSGGPQLLRYTSQAPTPFGSFDFPYIVSPTYTLWNVLLGSRPDSGDLSAEFRTLWDADNLYVFVRMSDDETVRHASPFPWENDSVEIYIDADHSAGTSYDGVNDFQLVLTVDNPSAVVTGVRSAPYAGGLTYFPIFPFRGNANDYELRISIPWTSLNVTPHAGAAIGLDVHVNDNDGSAQRTSKVAAFATVDDSWTNPSSFQTFVLGPVQPLPAHMEQAAGSITIDGVAQPGEWDHSDEYPIQGLLLGSRAPGFSASFRTVFDPSVIAFFVRVRDGQIIRDSAYPWEDDSVEIFLDPERSGSYDALARQYVFRPGDPTVYYGSRTPNPPDTGALKVATQVVPGGYDMEISVPWSRFGMPGGPLTRDPFGRPLLSVSQMGLDVQVNDDRNGGNRDAKIAKFATVDDAWENPASFGTLGLVTRE